MAFRRLDDIMAMLIDININLVTFVAFITFIMIVTTHLPGCYLT